MILVRREEEDKPMKLKLAFLLFLFSIWVQAEQRLHQFTIEDLWKMKRLDKLELSPDGDKILFTVTEFDLNENKGNSDIYMVDLRKGGGVIRLTNWKGVDTSPRFLPDGSGILFISDREGDTPQVFLLKFGGGDPERVTDMPLGVKDLRISPDGKGFIFSADIYSQCLISTKSIVDCSRDKVKEKKEAKTEVKIITRIPFRVWDEWRNDIRSHIFYQELKAGATPIDLTPYDVDSPPIDLGSSHDFMFLKDGRSVVVVMNMDKEVAWSTNNDLFIIEIPSLKIKKITENKGNDEGPVLSPDGKYIAFCSMERAGFESDKRELVIYEIKTGKIKRILEKFDLSVMEFVWASDSSAIYFTALDRGYVSLFKVYLSDGRIETLLDRGKYRFSIPLTPVKDKIYFLADSFSAPAEIYYFDLNTKREYKLTHFNDELVSSISWGEVGEFWFKGAKDENVHSFYIKPPQFKPDKKYGALVLIHGGPQGAWENHFHYRWNAQLFASQGYFVIMINFHGSIGYGQKFVDSVSKNWGTLPYEDIMKGVDYLLGNFKEVDGERMCALGASFGGYMVNWILGHTTRFKCLVSHAGVSNLISKYGTTDELWFPEWEFGGTPWDNPELYEKFSPIKFAKNFKTPTLVIHGAGDFRVPFSQAFELFTALQRQGVPSKLIFFPDETHFVTKPQNSIIWYKEVFDWLEKYLK